MRAVARTVLPLAARAFVGAITVIAVGVQAHAQAQAAQLAQPARGTLYIVGGGPQPAALVQEFVSLASGPGKARIVVFAMASSEGLTGGEEKAADLRALGAEARNVWITREQAMTDSVVRLLDGVTGIWFGGGDQVRLADVLRGTPTERAIHARYAAGAVIGGTSAGAAVMSAVMITGDERRPGGSRPDSTLAWGTLERDNVVTAEGFGLLPGAIVDQHFARRKRYGRLLALVLEREPHLGAGIDESTALVVRPDGRWQVRGAGSVVILDARRALRGAGGRLVRGSDISLHVLADGDSFDPASGQVAPAPPLR